MAVRFLHNLSSNKSIRTGISLGNSTLGVKYVKVRNIKLIGASLLLLVIASLYVYAKAPNAENKSDNYLSQEVNDFQEFLVNEGGFYKQVEEKLKEMGYEYQMMGVIYSKEEIWIKFILENKDATEQEKFEVAATFYEIAVKNNLDPKIFKVKVSNNDNPDW